MEIGGIASIMGPFAPGLESMQQILSLFVTVVDYLHYVLRYTTTIISKYELRYKWKYNTQIDGLYPLGFVSRFDPIWFLFFLVTMN